MYTCAGSVSFWHLSNHCLLTALKYQLLQALPSTILRNHVPSHFTRILHACPAIETLSLQKVFPQTHQQQIISFQEHLPKILQQFCTILLSLQRLTPTISRQIILKNSFVKRNPWNITNHAGKRGMHTCNILNAHLVYPTKPPTRCQTVQWKGNHTLSTGMCCKGFTRRSLW